MCVSLLQVGITFEQGLDTKGKQYTIRFCDKTVKMNGIPQNETTRKQCELPPPPPPTPKAGWQAIG